MQLQMILYALEYCRKFVHFNTANFYNLLRIHDLKFFKVVIHKRTFVQNP